MKISPKGIVEPTEMNSLCDKLRILLADRENVVSETDWNCFQHCTRLLRCFTYCERDAIDSCYGLYLWWQRKKLLVKEKYE